MSNQIMIDEREYSGIDLTFFTSETEWEPPIVVSVHKEEWSDSRFAETTIGRSYSRQTQQTLEPTNEGADYVVRGLMEKSRGSGIEEVGEGTHTEILCEDVPWVDGNFEVLDSNQVGNRVSAHRDGEKVDLYGFEVVLKENDE